MMVSLLTDPLFQISGQGRTNRNYYNFVVTKSDVIWRCWTISPRVSDRSIKPFGIKEPHLMFLDDDSLQYEVGSVFGIRILAYAKALCQGHYDYLERLPDSLLLRTTCYLEPEDVSQLGRTSRKFRKLCGSEEFWEQTVRQRCSAVSDEMASLALESGWRKVFFTNKLRLQGDKQEGEVSDEDTKAEASPNDSPGSHQTASPVEIHPRPVS